MFINVYQRFRDKHTILVIVFHSKIALAFKTFLEKHATYSQTPNLRLSVF